jgi:hypothetical protein
MALVPDERSLVEEMKDRPFAVLGVNLDDSPNVMKAVVKENEIPWRNWNIDDPAVIRRWRASELPTIYLIDHKGVIRYEHEDLNRPWKLEREIKKLVKEAEQDGGHGG